MNPQRASALSPAPAFSSAPSVESAIARIRERNEALRAILLPTFERAVRRVEQLDALPLSARGPLHRLPFSLKDVWDVAGLPTTAGSPRYRARLASEDSPIQRTLEAAGAVLVGKSNLSDLAFTPESDNTLLGPVTHPLDPRRTAGGSSGGAGAAVADGLAAFDWGSDFGGSIRLPAAFCGVVGLRLSARAWPVEGHFPRVSSDWNFQGMGPLAPTVAACGALLDVVWSLRRDVPQTGGGSAALLSPDEFSLGQWPGFEQEATAALAEAGVSVAKADLPSPKEIDRAFASLLASHLEQCFVGDRGWIVREVVRSLTWGQLGGRVQLHPHTAKVLAVLAGARVLRDVSKSAAWARVRQVREAAQRVFDAGLLLVTPTTTFEAPLHGRALFAQGIAAFAKLGNVVDATCIAVPFGAFPSGLPRSIQVLGPVGSERAVLRLAEALEVVGRRSLERAGGRR